MKHTTKYLYGCESKDFSELIYRDALVYKIRAANGLRLKLVVKARENLENPSVYEDVLKRHAATEKAIKFNQDLLEELDR